MPSRELIDLRFSSGDGMPLENLVNGEAVPPFAWSACRDAIVVQGGCNAIKGHASGPEFLHADNNGLFAFRRTIGLAAFTAARSGFHALACATELQNDVGLFALCDGTLKLPEHDPVRIILQEIRLFHGNQFKAVALQFGDDAFLDGL